MPASQQLVKAAIMADGDLRLVQEVYDVDELDVLNALFENFEDALDWTTRKLLLQFMWSLAGDLPDMSAPEKMKAIEVLKGQVNVNIAGDLIQDNRKQSLNVQWDDETAEVLPIADSPSLPPSGGNQNGTH